MQTTTGDESKVEGMLRALLKGVRKSSEWPDLQNTALYGHASIPGSFIVQLTWEDKVPEAQGSQLALRLLEMVKTLVLADHSVWIQREQNKDMGQDGGWEKPKGMRLSKPNNKS
ncbi:MAG: hypothetical protein JW950_10235 [Deltaproteobacteria bacterium]|nr:hypothetical protein [Deltaproteobacteria bacterium]